MAAGVSVEPVVITAPPKRSLVETLMVRFDQGAIRIEDESGALSCEVEEQPRQTKT